MVSNQSARGRRPGLGALARFRRAERGAAAVEFAIVAIPFLSLLFMTMEVALTFFAGQALETALSDTSRLIMTGQRKDFSAATFKSELCSRAPSIIYNCSSNVLVSVYKITSWTTGSVPPPINETTGQMQFTEAFTKTCQQELTVARAIYNVPVLIKIGNFANNGNSHVTMSTVAFKNEPFGSCT